jgi:hypothetical protein
VHVGLPFGPTAVEPSQLGGRYTGTKLTPPPDVTCVLTALELARRANAQVFLNFTGNEQYLRDANGFSMTKWKTRLDRFRKVDFSSYIADGTVIGHFMLDEPNDPTNWNGHIVSQADIEEMARYSKEIWPTLPTFIRTFPEYLVGGQYPDLDAIWFHYLNRWGDLDAFLAEHMGTARSLGLNVIGGLNSLKGGSPEHGIKRGPKYSMGADELRKWGSRFLDEPGLCGFLLWDWDDTYFARPEIPPAVADLAAKARNYTARSCKK